MNATDLYVYLCDGAILKTRWKKRYFNTIPRMINTLTLKDGTVIKVQGSTIDGLWRRGLIRSLGLQAGRMDYEVIK